MGRYFITGGGTGGHIYPAIAVAEGTITTVEPAFKKEQFIVDECD